MTVRHKTSRSMPKRSSSGRLKVWLCFRHDLVSKIAAQKTSRIEVYPAPNDSGQLPLYAEEVSARCVTLLKLYQDVDVAFETETVAQDRPEDLERFNVVPAAELSDLVTIDVDRQLGHGKTPTRTRRKACRFIICSRSTTSVLFCVPGTQVVMLAQAVRENLPGGCRGARGRVDVTCRQRMCVCHRFTRMERFWQ